MIEKHPAAEVANASVGQSEKLERFRKHIKTIIHDLECNRSLSIHNNVSQFYYMEKVAELELLQAQLDETTQKLDRIQRHINVRYAELYHRWRKDVRWLKKAIRPKSGN